MLPLLYEHAHIRYPHTLYAFSSHLATSDRSWGSIHRIPFSTPGRWVKSLELTSLDSSLFGTPSHSLDSALSQLFPLLPFLETLHLPSLLTLSARTLHALASRDGAMHLRHLFGLRFATGTESAFLSLLRCTRALETLSFRAGTLQGDEYALEGSVIQSPLLLPMLHALELVAPLIPSLQHTFVTAHMPSLRHAILPVCSDLAELIQAYGQHLTHLILHVHPVSWPPISVTLPNDLLSICPTLTHLTFPSSPPTLSAPTSPHPLYWMSIARPDDPLLFSLAAAHGEGLLPALAEVRVRGARWLSAALGAPASAAGIQGEMRMWRSRLARRGVKLLDSVGAEAGEGERVPERLPGA
jgi:hypothetical protein